VLYPARISVSSSLLAATMNQKSSLREDPQFVSGVLTRNTWMLAASPTSSSSRQRKIRWSNNKKTLKRASGAEF
jgi:hypothetical protein